MTLSTKDSAYISGSILDFERAGRAPKVLQANVWQTDDPIGDTFGYTTEIKYKSAGSLVKELIDNVGKNGNLLLNLSPKADGTIPEEQQKILLEIGKWLEVNGEAIYERVLGRFLARALLSRSQAVPQPLHLRPVP